jgi:predicted metal-binding membrane protein
MDELAEGALRRHRAITIAALALLTALAWVWLASGAGMTMGAQFALVPIRGPGPPMDSMMTGWRPDDLLLTVSMWWVMMVAMMIPAAASTILLYARAARYRAAPGTRHPPTGWFLAGYLVVWGLFSVCAATLQAALEQAGLLAPATMQAAGHWLPGAVLIAAGLYQLGPFKNACLSHCRSPADFLSRHFRPGRRGAFHLGFAHGGFCVGCCWVLMALLFVGGVMNLAWIAILTLIVAAEKNMPGGSAIARTCGVALIALGVLDLAA